MAGRHEAIPELRWRGFEYGYARLGDLIRWAAGRESPVAVAAADAPGRHGRGHRAERGPARSRRN